MAINDHVLDDGTIRGTDISINQYPTLLAQYYYAGSGNGENPKECATNIDDFRTNILKRLAAAISNLEGDLSEYKNKYENKSRDDNPPDGLFLSNGQKALEFLNAWKKKVESQPPQPYRSLVLKKDPAYQRAHGY